MRAPFALSPLLCFLLVAFAHADEVAKWPEPYAGEGQGTIIDADSVEGEGSNHVRAEGDVHVQQAERDVRADVLDYYSDPERVIARGRVRYQQAGLVLDAEGLDYYTASQTGSATGINYQVSRLGRSGHGSASSINFVGPQHYELNQARFSTCDPGRRDWYIGAGHLDLDYGRNLGVARNATLHFFDVPLGWFPWMDFPLISERKTGLLAPRIGTISSGGFDLSLPFYWNIAPAFDMTLTPRYMAQRGMQLGSETRYLQPKFRGTLSAEWLNHDEKADRDRYGFNLQHAQMFSPLVKGGINYQKVSDYAYFADLGDRLSAATQVTLPQEVWLDYTSNHWRGLARVQRYQTLQDPSLPIAPPYWREPQLQLIGHQPLPARAALQFNGEWVRFRSDPNGSDALSLLQIPAQLEGERLHLYPALSWNLNTPFAFITPRAGWMFTDYRLDRAEDAHITRNVPVASLDSGVTFERDFKLKERTFTQTLEPRLYYVYIPWRDQDAIPNFDTNELTFNFAQMFSENRFSGVDKVNDANQLTLALSSRFLDSETGRERMRVELGQRFYFNEQRVNLDATTAAGTATRSDILFSAGGAINEDLRFDSAVQYKQTVGQIERGSLTFNYQPKPGKNLNLGYHYRHENTPQKENIRQIDGSVQWPIMGNWYGMGRLLYSLQDREMLESVAGLEYNAGCWILRLVRQRYVVAADRQTTATFVQLELNGLGGIGTNPLGVLRDSIFGYRKSNELSDH